VLKALLLHHNGGDVNNELGVTAENWRLLPVMDRSSRKTQTKTAEDIAWYTKKSRMLSNFPKRGVVIARAWNDNDRLFFQPDRHDAAQLSDQVYRQFNDLPPTEVGSLDPFLRKQETSTDLPDREPIPDFRYHPNPLATGSLIRTQRACPSCGEFRGFGSAAEPYAIQSVSNICPWCIADGSAANKFDAAFSDAHPLLESGIAPLIVSEATERTPGFVSMQQEEWQSCCNDACAYEGHISSESARLLSSAQLDALWLPTDEPLELDDDVDRRDLSLYVFRCLHCREHKYVVDVS